MTRPGLTVMCVVALSAVTAGCGSNSNRSSGSRPTPAQMQADAVRFARCMRAHGVSNFPDPTSPREFKASLSPTSTSNPPPAFQAAEAACRHLLPRPPGGPQDKAEQIRTRLADGLSFARCMRAHGVVRFPDPTSQGELTVPMVQAQGIDLHSPVTLQAVQACLPASHGALTAAKVRAALKKAGG